MARYCQYCGCLIEDGDNFCGSCGCVTNEVPEMNQQKRKNRLVIGIVAGVLALLITAGVVIMFVFPGYLSGPALAARRFLDAAKKSDYKTVFQNELIGHYLSEKEAESMLNGAANIDSMSDFSYSIKGVVGVSENEKKELQRAFQEDAFQKDSIQNVKK